MMIAQNVITFCDISCFPFPVDVTAAATAAVFLTSRAHSYSHRQNRHIGTFVIRFARGQASKMPEHLLPYYIKLSRMFAARALTHTVASGWQRHKFSSTYAREKKETESACCVTATDDDGSSKNRIKSTKTLFSLIIPCQGFDISLHLLLRQMH